MVTLGGGTGGDTRGGGTGWWHQTCFLLRGNSVDVRHLISIAREEKGTTGGLRGLKRSSDGPRWFLSASLLTDPV